MNTSFPRLSSLSKEDVNYIRAKRLNKDMLLAQIFQLQAERDQLNGQAAMLEHKVKSQSLQDWSDVLNRANQLATERAKSDTKRFTRATWKDLKKIASSISFQIRTA